MDVLSHLERMFAYDEWANREVLANLKSMAAPPPRALRLLNHVVGAELLWLARLEQRAAPLAVWPELALDECAKHVRELPRRWQDYFADVAPEDLLATIAYRNSRGERHESAIGDVLTHVCMHGTYHRGQIALEVRSCGRDPAYTDFIHCTRQGFLG